MDKLDKILIEHEVSSACAFIPGGSKVTFGDTKSYEIMSVSKFFVIIAMGLMVDRMVIKLTDNISKWFPEYKHITVHELLNHTSGIDATWDSACDIYKACRNRKIGTKSYKYNNYGYNLLVQILDNEYGANKLYRELANLTKIKYKIRLLHGIPIGAYGIRMTTLDLCKFAENYPKIISKTYYAISKSYMMKYEKYIGYDGSNGQFLVISPKVIFASCRTPQSTDYTNDKFQFDLTDSIPTIIKLLENI